MQSVSLGASVALFCVVDGEPKPMIRWTKDGLPITNEMQGGSVQISEDGVHLRIPSAEENDAGRYACIAVSPYGEVSKQFDIKVTCKCHFYNLFKLYMYYGHIQLNEG